MQSSKPIRNNTDLHINSYDTHQFLIKFLKDDKEYAGSKFIKGPKEEVITVRFNETTLQFNIRQATKYDDVMENIRAVAKSCSDLNGDEYTTCLANAVIDDVLKITDSKSKLKSHRDKISNRLRNYTCADDTMNTSKPIDTKMYYIGDNEYRADIYLDMDSAKIWSIDNMISDEECDVLMEWGRPRLKRATVAAEDGSSIVSENRKAQQTSYNLHQVNPQRDPLWPLFNRILAITNSHGGFQMKPDGQEDFTIIQYNVDDQYTPHCDGSCDESLHNSGGRVATAVMYCKVAERGGGTTFTKADVFIKPTKGQVTFFSYRGSDKKMDEGYTEHSGCPVLEGEKWITTMWMRDGVSHEKPWTMFDPNGIPMMTPEEQALLATKGEDESQGEL